MKARRYMALAAALAALLALSCCDRQPEPPIPGESAGSTSSFSSTMDEPSYFVIPDDESTSRTGTSMDRSSTSAESSLNTVSGSTSAQSSAQSSTAGQSTAARSTTAKSTATTAAKGGYPYDYPGIHPVAAVVREDEWYLLLVNRDFSLPAGYSPKTAVCLPGVYPENRELDARVAPKYREMYNAAKLDGIELIPYSGYRRTSTQKSNFENKVAAYRNQGYSNAEAVNLAAKIVLPPGCSEHEAGLAMDIVRPGVWELQTSFDKTKEFTWLMEHAEEYGFILRYPKDKQGITKITYEPWHWRYVGTEAARAIMARGICLEEYLGS